MVKIKLMVQYKNGFNKLYIDVKSYQEKNNRLEIITNESICSIGMKKIEEYFEVTE